MLHRTKAMDIKVNRINPDLQVKNAGLKARSFYKWVRRWHRKWRHISSVNFSLKNMLLVSCRREVVKHKHGCISRATENRVKWCTWLLCKICRFCFLTPTLFWFKESITAGSCLLEVLGCVVCKGLGWPYRAPQQAYKRCDSQIVEAYSQKKSGRVCFCLRI